MFITLTSLFMVALVAAWVLWSIFRTDRPRLAPEAERILQAQATLPFQVLIPAFLPAQFNRETVEILTKQTGPQGEAMLQLVYSTNDDQKITITEYVPLALTAEASENNSDSTSSLTTSSTVTNPNGALGMRVCTCANNSQNSSNINAFMIDVGPLHAIADNSASQGLTREQIQAVLNTLSPAADLMTYTTIQDVPITSLLPEAVEIPINDEGVQDLVLIVTPQGYSPAHFSVKKDIPVRITFRQLGYVDCGNVLNFQWGSGRQATLVLETQDDKETLVFTPEQTGDFQFNCSYLHYIGVMSVLD